MNLLNRIREARAKKELTRALLPLADCSIQEIREAAARRSRPGADPLALWDISNRLKCGEDVTLDEIFSAWGMEKSSVETSTNVRQVRWPDIRQCVDISPATTPTPRQAILGAFRSRRFTYSFTRLSCNHLTFGRSSRRISRACQDAALYYVASQYPQSN